MAERLPDYRDAAGRYAWEHRRSDWWLVDPETPHEVAARLFGQKDELAHANQARRSENLRNSRIYGNTNTRLEDFSPRAWRNVTADGRVTINAIEGCVDTLVSDVTKTAVKSRYLTKGGTWDSMILAENLEKFDVGTAYKNKLTKKLRTAFRDACLWDVGVLKVYRVDKEIRTERAFANEILVDPEDSFYGTPSIVLQNRWVSRAALLRDFPDHASALLSAGVESGHVPSMIECVEGWWLNGKQGRHVLAIANDTLVDERYKREVAPFVFVRYMEPQAGFFGCSLVSKLVPLQLQLNKQLRRINDALNLVSGSRVWMQEGSTAFMTNEIGAVSRYRGQPPIFQSVNAVPDEQWRQAERLEQKIFETAGISQLAARQAKPAGVESGIALRELRDVQSSRFALTILGWEDARLEVSAHYVELAREIAESGGGRFSTTSVNTNQGFLEAVEIDFRDFAVDDFTIQAAPASMLPEEPAGAMQTVVDMLQAGIVRDGVLKAEDLRRMMRWPDPRAVYVQESAPSDLIESIVSSMMRTGDYDPPESFMPLEMGIAIMQRAYLEFRRRKAPEDRLELLRRWVTDATGILDDAQAPPPASEGPAEAMPAAPEGAPVGGPEEGLADAAPSAGTLVEGPPIDDA